LLGVQLHEGTLGGAVDGARTGRQHLRVVSAAVDQRIAKRRRQANASLAFGVLTFALAVVGFLFWGLTAPLAVLTAGASIVCGALGLRRPRTRSAVVLVVVAMVLVAVPAAAVVVVVVAFASGGIE
jgi:hypothetical protein